MRRRWLLAGLAGGLAALGGCSVLPQPAYVQRRDWPLVMRRETALPERKGGRVLLVRSIQPGPGLDQRGLQWLNPDGSVHVDFYEEWAVPPADAVTDDVRQWLADAGLFSAVVAPGSRLNPDFTLEGQLNALIADPKAGTARASLALVLIDQRPSPVKVLLQKTESAEVRLSGDTPSALVDALKAALAEVLRRAEQDIAAAVGVRVR
jgi:cholesterol transport system auxiliary component